MNYQTEIFRIHTRAFVILSFVSILHIYETFTRQKLTIHDKDGMGIEAKGARENTALQKKSVKEKGEDQISQACPYLCMFGSLKDIQQVAPSLNRLAVLFPCTTMRTAPNLFTGVHDHVFACFGGSKQVYPSHLLCQSSDALFCKHMEGSYGNNINRNEHISKHQSLMMV